MYSTKYLNKNIVQGNAYISIGDPYKDRLENMFRQPKKGETLKPFHITAHPPNQENGNFSKVRYESGQYKEGNLYIETQPLDARKLGFGSKDAHRRDEFSNAVRTEQYRETLRKELVVNQKFAEQQMEEIEAMKLQRATTAPATLTRTRKHPFNETYTVRVPQYDIGRTRVTPFDPKSTKDTFYKFDGNYDKRLGSTAPASYLVGDSAWDVTYRPPQHGGRSEVKNFFDKSHLKVGNY